MKIGMRGHDLKAASIAELAAKCADIGIPTLQLALGKSVPGFRKGLFSPGYAKGIGAALREKAVDVTVLGCYINPSESDPEKLEQNLSLFEESLQYAKFIGADMVGLETGFVGTQCIPENNQTEEAYQYLLRNMRRLVSTAEKLGVMIGVEGVHLFVVNTPEKMRRLLDDLNSPNVCVIFDPVNYLNEVNFRDQEGIMERACRLLADKMAVVHLKDFVVTGDSIAYGPLCENGSLNRAYLFDLLRKFKPNLPVILEEVTEETFPTIAAQVAEEMA